MTELKRGGTYSYDPETGKFKRERVYTNRGHTKRQIKIMREEDKQPKVMDA